MEKSESGLDAIKKGLDTKQMIFGTSQVLKYLKVGKLERIFISSNSPENVKKEIKQFAEHFKIPVEGLMIPNDELGVICKKPFLISVLGFVKE